jgi:hypothetical protein
MRVLSALLVAVLSTGLLGGLASCSGNSSPEIISSKGRAPFPEVPYQGGSILTAPQIVTVTFPGDTMAEELTSFAETLGASNWWSKVTAGYCEGAGGTCIAHVRAAKSVVYPSAPAKSYTDSETPGSPSTLQEWLRNAIASGNLPSPEGGSVSNTIYLMYFPASTTITLDDLPSCQLGGFDGYHSSTTIGSQQVPYAVVPECPGGAAAGNTPPITTLQNTTVTASHEILEATTDPDPNASNTSAIGYYLDFTNANLGWIDIQGGGELADLCIDPFLLDQDETPEGSFTVQRIWSNAQAAAGLDPCNPIPSGEVYFNASPASSYFVMDVGSSVTFEVNAFSMGSRGDWTLGPQDWSITASNSSAAPGYLDFTIAGASDAGGSPSVQVNNGSSVNVTMTLLKDPGNLSTGEADGSIVSVSFSATTQQPTAAHFWPFVVLTPSDASNEGLDAALSSGRADDHPTRTHHAFRRRPAVAVRAIP